MDKCKRNSEIWSGHVRLGRLQELERLAELEIDATMSLIEAGAALAEAASATPRHLMEAAFAEGLVFVATDADDQPLGFLAGGEQDGGLYIGEIDVWRRWQGRGIGRAMILAALAEARRRNLWGAMLTTDRFAPFNRPFYAKLGFIETSFAHLPPSLVAVLEAEISRGHDPARRVGMLLRFSDTDRT